MNVHPNCVSRTPSSHRRLTHKQQIAVQTFSDIDRYRVQPGAWFPQPAIYINEKLRWRGLLATTRHR